MEATIRMSLILLLGAVSYGTVRYARQPVEDRILTADQVRLSVSQSNVMPGDYVGAETCAKCHPKEHSDWLGHPHRVMNQNATPESIKADFDNAQLELPSGTVEFTTDEDEYFMTVKKDGEVFRKYLVTRTVGSRYMQYFIGSLVKGPEPVGHIAYDEVMLPFTFSIVLNEWFPRQYFDADGDEKLVDGVPQVEAVNCEPEWRAWKSQCIQCHNTLPYVYRVFHRKGVGFVDNTVAVTVGPMAEELRSKHGIDVDGDLNSFLRMGPSLNPEEDLVSLGISCESCHLGGREHAIEAEKIRFLPTSKYITLLPKLKKTILIDDRKSAPTITGTCIQCHSGGSDPYPNGAAVGNSGEASDFHSGFCASEMRCVDCHDPHTAGKMAGTPDIKAHYDLCVKCHDKYADESVALAHTNHPQSANLNCMDCHMPKYTQGLDNFVRTHKISHPVEESMVREGSANACNFCHLEKSTRWTLDELEKGWGRKLRPNPFWSVFFSMDQPLGEKWLHSDVSALRALATQAYADRPAGKRRIPDLVRALNDPEPLNRVFARFAVQDALGRDRDAEISVDIRETPAVRRRQISEMIQALESHSL